MESIRRMRPFSFIISQQLSLDDSSIMLTARERNALEKSWAKIFADDLWCAEHIEGGDQA